nr:hypothetical protein [Tanacetum cinerariifolium]
MPSEAVKPQHLHRKPAESEGFKQILDFLNGSSIRYALTASPTIRTSCIKQFYSTDKVKTVDDEVRVQALIDAKRVTIKESSIRCILKLDDEEGISCLANDDIFTGLANMGYEKISDKLTFYKAFFSLQSLWHQQSSVLPQTRSLTSQAVEEVGQAQDDVSIPTEPSTSKPHKKHKSKKQQPIAPMDSLKFQELMDLCTRLSNKVLDLKSEVIDIKSSFTDKIEKLEDRVHKLKEENMILKEKPFKYANINTAAPVEDKEESFKQGRMITDMDEDVEDINEEEPTEVEEVLEVVTTAKLITEIVTTAEPTTTAAQIPKASTPRRRRGVVIQDLEEIATSFIVHTEVQPKDKGKGILIEEPKPLKRQAQIEQDKAFARQQNNEVMRYQALKRKPLTEAQAKKNMMIYLKNMVSFKMNFFKVMTYSEIRPLFEKHYNLIQSFPEKVDEEVTVQEREIEEEGNKRQGESLEQEIAKKQRMDKEAEELQRYLQIVANDDDDVYTEATPLASKVPVVDYQIHYENNKSYYKKSEQIELTKPKNFSDDFLLNILKIMFEKPNIEANVCKDQKGRYGLAKVKSWKLFESCGVHIITLTTIQMFLLVEKKYPLTHFTLEQMLNNVRLEVEEESEMSLELPRLVRRQLNEGYAP